MAFEENKTTRREESLIPNTQIESMFLRICTDEEMAQYTKHIDNGRTSLATAYAQNKISEVYYPAIDLIELEYGSLENFKLEKKNKKFSERLNGLRKQKTV